MKIPARDRPIAHFSPTHTTEDINKLSSEPAQTIRCTPNGLVHSLFEERARTSPEIIALQFGRSQSMTYKELNEVSNAVARLLVCGRGSFVPIAVQRSSQLVIALLAVLKTGAAYVILALDAPDQRNQYVVEDSRASFVITDENTKGRFPRSKEVDIGELVRRAIDMNRQNLCIYQEPTEHAYLIYTSGTTGNPKGVLLSHRAVCSGLSTLSKFSSRKGFRQLLCHSPSFSAAQRTILGTLTRGGTLCLATKDDLTLRLKETITEMGITGLEITPSMLKLINPSDVSDTVTTITLGGEMVSPSLVDLWSNQVELVTSYGLTEVTQLNMRRKLEVGGNHRLIGRPLDTTMAFVLAPNSTDLLLLGQPGELCLAGPQLADGYLNLPQKTQEAFILNPFGPGKLYRTGDMVVAHDYETFELIGRIDQQTKINGQRVEPNESNAIIQMCEGVATSVVVSAGVLGRRALIAIIVPQSHQEWTSLIREIRDMLRSKLPSYAIPTHFVQLEELPINVNGKVDIAALVKQVEALPEEALISRSAEASSGSEISTAPNRTIEERVATTISGVLSISVASVSLASSFQELGGTSLDAIVTVSKLRSHGIQASVSDILTSISLREIPWRYVEYSDVSIKRAVPFTLLPSYFEASSSLDLVEFDDVYPVTPLQEGIITDSMLGRARYVYRRIYKLNGVSPAEVKPALEKVIAQNSILRTIFVPWKRTFVQAVKPTASLEWRIRTETSLESHSNEAQIEEMSLEEGPLIRVSALKDHLLAVEMHHALFDYWSSQFLFEDANAILKGQQVVPRAPFVDYVAWQKMQHGDEAKTFWKEYLENPNPSNVLSLAHNQSATNRAFVAKLKNSPVPFSNSHGITLGSLVHAAWALVLAKMLGSLDVLFITAFSGRDAEIDGILNLFGPTLCTVPMRVRIDKGQSLLDFAKAVQRNLWMLSKFAHSGLKNALVESGLKASTLNTMINILVKQRNVDDDAPLIPVLTHEDNFTQYITIEIDENDPFQVKLLVPSGIDDSAANSTLDSLVHFVNIIVTHPNEIVSVHLSAPPVPLKEDMNESQILARPKPQFGLAHIAFEQHASANPAKLAIRSISGEPLSYGAFNSIANKFANWLLRHDVKHGDMIPLYMDKSITTLISIFGIIKAGAAFVPLDPRNPQERNAFIVKDVCAKQIITDAKNSMAASTLGADLIISEQVELEKELDERPVIPGLSPSSVIYVIYTSGSTGLPKGVIVSHSAVTASTDGMIKATRVTSEWNALWVLNYVFDASYYDVFTIFSAGATLCLGPQDELLSDLAGVINKMGIQQVMLTPTITKLIRDGPTQVPGLKVLNVCGERIDINILQWAKQVDVYNGYGPTEATILMTVDKVMPDGNLNRVGFPLKHAEAVILPVEGSSLEPILESQIGELCVKGPHLAQGYLNCPEQTSAAFVRDKDGALLYRTGDLARWLPDGSLECSGRIDHQVKLNGFRIELGEIENAVLQTGDVESCIVSVAEVEGKRQLVAFCIFNGDAELQPTGLLPLNGRAERAMTLKSKLTTLSHYMMPSVFFPFGLFPTLPSGKSDRRALTALVEQMDRETIATYLSVDGAAEDFQPVTTDEEIAMQEAWSNVLGMEKDKIGASSSFLGLGGDSIAAINVVAACRKLSFAISVSDILGNATLVEQAQHLRPMKEPLTVKHDIHYEIPPAIYTTLSNLDINVDKSIDVIYPCGPGQIEFLIQTHKQEQFWNLTAIRELPEDFDLALWLETTKSLTAQNQILRTTYMQADPEDHRSWYQVVLRDPILNWEEFTYSNDSEKQKFVQELRNSLFPFGTPNVKYTLLRSSVDGSRTLCIKVDHGNYDGTLLRILDEQFIAIARGQTPPALHSFRHFVDFVYRADRDDALGFWAAALRDYEPVSNLIPLHPITNCTKFITVQASVDEIAAHFNVTPSTVFQVAYALLLSHLFGTSDVLLDNLVTGRTADIENAQLINGTCANFLPFRTRMEEHDTLARLLKDTQNNFWKTTEHGTVGLNDIYAHLGKDRQNYSAKALFCFQPFEPAPPAAQQNHMRWIVMAQSKTFITVNYALMVEVQKTFTGHRIKCQWDSRALSTEQADATLNLYNEVLNNMHGLHLKVKELIPQSTSLQGLWRL